MSVVSDCFERKCYLSKIQDSLVAVVDYVNIKESAFSYDHDFIFYSN